MSCKQPLSVRESFPQRFPLSRNHRRWKEIMKQDIQKSAVHEVKYRKSPSPEWFCKRCKNETKIFSLFWLSILINRGYSDFSELQHDFTIYIIWFSTHLSVSSRKTISWAFFRETVGHYESKGDPTTHVSSAGHYSGYLDTQLGVGHHLCVHLEQQSTPPHSIWNLNRIQLALQLSTDVGCRTERATLTLKYVSLDTRSGFKLATGGRSLLVQVAPLSIINTTSFNHIISEKERHENEINTSSKESVYWNKRCTIYINNTKHIKDSTRCSWFFSPMGWFWERLMEAPSFDGATLVSKNHCHSNKVLQKQHCGVVSTEQWVVAAKRSKLVSVRPSCVSRVNLLGSAVSSGEPVNSQPKYQSANWSISVQKQWCTTRACGVNRWHDLDRKTEAPACNKVATIGTKVLIVLICW